MTSIGAHGLDELPCGYVEMGPDGIVTAANRHFLSLVDRPSDEVVGARSLPSMLPVGDRMYYETHVRPALQMHGEIHEIAVELVRPDGARVPILLSANTTGGDAPVTRVIVFAATDRRKYEQELLRARHAAEEAEATARTLAQALQQSFIPPSMPHVPGLEVVGAYRPAGDGSEVGGDFYDAFQIRDGEWVVVVGDVSGKGVEAAVVTSFVQRSVRALAVQWDDPSRILRELNTAMIEHGTDRFCTIVVLRLLKDDDRWLVTISSGGHPLPLLVGAAGFVTEVGAPGSLIGVLATPQLGDDRLTLGTGDSLVIYTDGVTEARSADGLLGADGLFEVVSGGVTSAAGTTAAVLARALDFQDGQARDDIAIVTLRVVPEADPAVPQQEARLDPEEKNRALRALQGLDAAD